MCQRPPQFAFNPSAQQFQPSVQPQNNAQHAPAVPAVPVRAQSFIGSFNCPDETGFYPHVKSCDKYWTCDNGKHGN